ncbi:MAG: imidazoleglycerol-phosphate dehydratase HisB [bacterium]
MDRTTRVERKTKETEVKIFLNLDGKGESKINTPYPFLDHMLSLFAHHGFFDLEIYAKGDTQIDYHHLVEDVGICLGKAVKNALGEKKGIKRYGNCFVPMDDVLVQVALDISGRPRLVFNFPSHSELELANEFFQGFSSHSGITLHINLCYGDGVHHLMEAIFKAFALSLDEATRWEHRRRGVPSTKETME